MYKFKYNLGELVKFVHPDYCGLRLGVITSSSSNGVSEGYWIKDIITNEGEWIDIQDIKGFI